jgi:hypothetical protein
LLVEKGKEEKDEMLSDVMPLIGLALQKKKHMEIRPAIKLMSFNITMHEITPCASAEKQSEYQYYC